MGHLRKASPGNAWVLQQKKQTVIKLDKINDYWSLVFIDFFFFRGVFICSS